jgi:hypothetical protein
MADKFDKKLAEEQKLGASARLEDAPPIGANADGEIEIYAPGNVPPYEPTIIGGEEPDDDVEDVADLEGDA